MKTINKFGLGLLILGCHWSILWHINHAYVNGGVLTVLGAIGLGFVLLLVE